MFFFCYFPLKNNSIKGLFSDFLKKTSKKITISYRHFLKKDKSNNFGKITKLLHELTRGG